MAAELKRIHITTGNQNGMLRNQKVIIGLDSFSNQRLIHLDNTSLCIDYTVLLKVAKLQLLSVATCCIIYCVTVEA